MRKIIASHIKIPEQRVNIKAATTEKLGWVGKGQGMAAAAVVLLRRK
jgi:2C-methyl-D-erythritol 2,4-cyclodiphosphate synthase